MAAYKSLIALFAVVAVVAATNEQPAKEKRAVFVGAYPYATHAAYAAPVAYAAPAAPAVAYAAPAAYAAPYAAPAVAYAAPVNYYDDGKYFPGKYEKPKVYYG